MEVWIIVYHGFVNCVKNYPNQICACWEGKNICLKPSKHIYFKIHYEVHVTDLAQKK